MMASENIAFEAEFKDSLYHGKFRFCYWDVKLFYILNHSANFESYDDTMGISRVGFNFKCILWIVNHLLVKLGQQINMFYGQYFWEIFCMI